MIITYHILLGLAGLTSGAGLSCGSDTPLDTPYFSPFYKRVRQATGCSRAATETEEQEVHVIRLDQPADNVFLYVTGSSNLTRLSLVLATPSPVTWHLTISGFSSQRDILISDGSKVLDIESGEELATSPAILSTVVITENLALAKFSYIHSFTSVSGANRIFVRLPSTELSQSCDVLSEARSDTVEAFQVEKQLSFGCYHQEAAGLLPNDVHVIDLRQKIVKRSVEDDYNNVVVELAPDQVQEDLLPRNLTLILKSDKPVKWIIKSKGIKGQLVVAAGKNEVENLSDNTNQDLDIRNAEIPDDTFERLMKEVTQHYGIPLSYMRVHQANLLEMLIPPRSKREVSNLFELNMPSYIRDEEDLQSYSDLHHEDPEDKIYVVAEEIETSMVKECDEQRKQVSITLPSQVVAKHGIGSITLNDPTCSAVEENSQWIVKSHTTQCGSIALTYGSSPMYRNNLNIEFSRGALAGQKTKVPFICKFKPGIPGISSPIDYEESDDEDDYYAESDETGSLGEEMYSLKVQLLSEHDEARATLLEKRTDSAAVAVGDKIYVASHINAVPYLALAMEQCWISNTSHVTSHASPQDQLVINAGCPTNPRVNMHWDKGSSNSAFSFKINDELASNGKIWIQCRMGLCSATTAGANGNIQLCVDPKTCADREAPHLQSSLQQITVRGPLHIVPGNAKIAGPPPQAEDTEQREDRDKYNSQTSHTLVEVPVEVAVAIALASFLVGAMSTGVLWFLHSKAMQAKSRRLRAEGNELQSMLGFNSNQPPPGPDQNANTSCAHCPLVSA